MNEAAIKRDIRANAERICLMHARIQETFRMRDRSDRHRAAWSQACSELHANYASLSFPCDFREALRKIREGDPAAVEYALCFVEVRPYFFRSGYMYKDLIRKLKNAELDGRHRERRDAIVLAYGQWRQSRRNTGAP